MKTSSKIYRIFLWCGMIFCTICLAAAFFIETPVEAEKHDLLIYRICAVVLFAIADLAFAMKLFYGKSVFTVGNAGHEITYWVVVFLSSAAVSYSVSFAHTDKYRSDYAAYTEAQKAAYEESSEAEITTTATEEKNDEPTKVTTTAEITTTKKATTTKAETTTMTTTTTIVETEASEPDAVSDALISSEGITYYFDEEIDSYNNDEIDFGDFSIKFNRLKMKTDVGLDRYLVFVDYTLYNHTGEDLNWMLERTGNIYGNLRYENSEYNLAGNQHIEDADFKESEMIKRNYRGTISQHESCRYFTGMLVQHNTDILYGKIKENDYMEFDLYFLVDGINYVVTVEIN